MSSNISFGQFYNVDSPIHRLDPRVKIHLFLLFAISSFCIKTMLGMICAFAILIIVVFLTKIPPKTVAKSLKACWIIFLFPLIFNLFMIQGEPVFQYGFITITDLGIWRSVFFTIRIVVVFVSASLLMMTTSALALCDATEYLLRPFAKIKVPVDDISMMVSIAIRFIPTMGEEFDSIKKAQLSRGANFEEGGLIKKARAMAAILTPLFIGAYRRTEHLAIAMESRCYGCGIKRTKYRELKTRPADWIAIAIVIAFLIISIILA